MIFTTTEALISLAPNAIWRTEKPIDGPETIVWIEGNRPTNAQITAEIARLQAEYDSKEYQRKRAAEYPNFKDYLDGIVKGDQEQIQEYIDACLAVKAKYPKPE